MKKIKTWVNPQFEAYISYKELKRVSKYLAPNLIEARITVTVGYHDIPEVCEKLIPHLFSGYKETRTEVGKLKMEKLKKK